ncbi:MAG: hydantoinase/oxoprolinase family protein [Salinarimonas sp.]
MKIGVDIGGTFTDLVMLDPDTGRLFNEKVLTTPDDPSRGVLTGITSILEKNGVAPDRVTDVIHGTTLVANALIERKGVKTALVTTRGFRDIVQIGREWRYDTYDLFIENVEPLTPRSLRFEVSERLGFDGAVLMPLAEDEIRGVAASLREAEVEAVAVCFLHAFRNPAHEQRCKAILEEELPDATICISSEVMPEIGEYERSSTTIANAYVLPTFRRYIRRLAEGIRQMGIARDVFLMQSDGGTVHQDTAIAFPIRLVQSGPAGGVQAGALIGRLAGRPNLMCFDMGGTTAKAALIENHQPSRTTDFEVARIYRFKKGSGLPLKVPVIDMIEIGAGGGSIARIDGMGLIQVGPDSASAVPGPACYGQGGTDPTVTDADLVLGYLDPGSFLGGEMRLDREAARRAIAEQIAEPLGIDVIEAAFGIHETVNESMARAAAVHTLEKGLRPTDFAMAPIGGAGPVHACHVARKMGMREVICPAGAGVASAFGFLCAPMSFEFVHADVTPLSELDLTATRALFSQLEARGQELLSGAGLTADVFSVTPGCAMRYVGQGYEVDVPLPADFLARGRREEMLAAFEAAYRALYGRIEDGLPVEIVSWRVVIRGPYPDIVPMTLEAAPDLAKGRADHARKGERPIYDGQARAFVNAGIYDRYQLRPGMEIAGPAIVEERESTLVVPAGARVTVDRHGNLIVDLGD